MMEVIRLIYEDSIKLLKRQGVEFETGLTIEEITKIEDIYTIKFPKSLKEFLMMTLPISKGFFNWRNLDQDNVMFIKKIINRPRNLGNDGIKGGYRGGRMMISLEERYENFKKTIQECGSYLLTESDDTIKYNLFEEFSIDGISFLHEDTLNLFLNEGMIDDDILEESIELRNLFMQLEKNEELPSVEVVRTSEEWKRLLRKSDEIRKLLYW